MAYEYRRFGALSSSQDPTKLAAWVTGIIISSASTIVWVLAGIFNFPISIEQVTAAAAPLGTVVGAIWFLFGLIRTGISKAAEQV